MALFPKITPIRVRDSQPIDPAAPSFLTLPNETRNDIYNLLFECLDPIEVLHDNGSNSYDRDTQRELASALPLLRTCASIYKEAASTLYANNTFVFARGEGHDHGMKVLHAAKAGHWMKGIGSQVPMLRKVHMDLDGSCPARCEDLARYWEPETLNHYGSKRKWKASVEMSPLLFVLWANPGAKTDIKFVHGRGKRHFIRRHLGDTEDDTGIDPDALTKVMKLLQEDTLGLKKYWRSILSIDVLRDGSRGLVVFGHSKNIRVLSQAIGYDVRSFSVSNDYTSMQFTKPKPHSFLKLPCPIRCAIQDAVTKTPDPRSYTYIDLDKKTFTGGSLALTSICRALRRTELYRFWVQNKIRVQLASQEPRTTFSNFSALEKWWCVNKSKEYENEGRIRSTGSHSSWGCCNTGSANIQIFLLFQCLDSTRLYDLRIGALDLIRVLSHAPTENFEVVFSLARGEEKPTTEHAVTLSFLRREVLDALLEYRQVHPEKGSDHCPQVWINGRGTVAMVGPDARDFSQHILLEKNSLDYWIYFLRYLVNHPLWSESNGSESTVLRSPW
ncbi:hypothetical protein CC80DRAFT_594434 [Byssothecium circinans]|uniref:Uncharacterized protein n=1 Tax=Byssothecium circinans TaxID=147558 RepID=A0A6A5TS62_9PLEO|nr:hypothetical protein CC80DRAFT_594434 [Byssothecium circinans]